MTTATGDLLAALCHRPHPGHIRGILTVVLRGELDLGVGTRLPAPMVGPGRSGPSSSRQRMFPHRLVGGVGLVGEDLGADHPFLSRKVTGEGSQHPGEVPAQTGPPPLPPLVESWS